MNTLYQVFLKLKCALPCNILGVPRSRHLLVFANFRFKLKLFGGFYYNAL